MRCFVFAFRGVARTIATQRNMRVHLAFAFYAVMAGFVCGISPGNWCAVMLCIGAVTALECLNTAVEAVCDRISGEYDPFVEIAKDAAAGAVLCAAVCAAVVGCVIFFSAESLEAAARFAEKYPMWAAVIVLTVPLWIKFIFMRRTKPCQTSRKTQ
ncbi:MAG: diacylglycerol kinase family protein [Candidatus Heteroscillospira sp.]|jgi:diacylglycerol kinase